MAKKNAYVPKVESLQFVAASDLFGGIGDKETNLWEQFAQEGNHPFTWGNNNRSLVCAYDILNFLDGSSNVNEKWVEQLRDRVDTLVEKADTYIDLEN